MGISNAYFPKQKASLSYFQPFSKVWQAEVGARYTKMHDSRNFLTGILGVERTFNNVWVNAKGLIMQEGNSFYHSIFTQSRFFLKNEKNYVTAMALMGTVPEDQKLDFQVNTFTSYVNTMVGAGYYHYLNARTSVGMQGNWYNFKVSSTAYVNQYNLFVTLRTRF